MAQEGVSHGFRAEAETEPFLNNKIYENSQSHTKPWWSTKLFILLHLILITSYTIICIAVLSTRRKIPILMSDAISDLRIAIKPTLSITAGASPFAGGPDREIDQAWHELLGNTSIMVSSEELRRNGNHQESIALSSNDEMHLAWLGVFHQLHCLKQLRQLNYRDHYHPNMTEEEARDLEVHINHCIEQLRQAVMCNPDTSLTTFVWTDTQTRPVLDVRTFERQCVDWEVFMSAITPRVISKETVEALKNPWYNETEA